MLPRSEPLASDKPASLLRIDAISATVLIVLSAVVLAWLIPAQISTDAGEYDLSPSFFPSVGAWIVLTLAVLLLLVRVMEIVSRVRKREVADSPAPNQAASKPLTVGPIATEFLAWTVAGVAVFYLLPFAGFLPTAVLIVMLGTRICGRRDWLPGIALGVAFCWLVQAGAWSLFTVALP